ncbi:transmembrane emp24 domain-containing protein p24delta9-like [Helianthus annuus]|uniref:transmembrane emp24 domain-containing protein p24delta9-like n=1 Tax=Helianthus annuus TaxID=4232 RepID=UPI001652F3F2|nr:transmembrane emp24 domain-containing protein p24delta9-like [Helianthus annuus]
MKLQRSAHCFIAIIGLLSTIAHSIRFEIESGHTKCIAEDIKSNSMTVGHYSIVNPNEGQPLPESHRITLRLILLEFLLKILDLCVFLVGIFMYSVLVTSAYGNSYHSSENVQSGQFAFQAVEAGD